MNEANSSNEMTKATGKRYWRGLEEYAESPEFHSWLEREFPAGANEFWGGDTSRRSFLKLMGASMALAGLGLSGCRRPEAHIVPFTETPEWMVPGKTVRYATAYPGRRGALPLLVSSYEGRPIKIDGNHLYKPTTGGTTGFAQASILDLYDPHRSKIWKKDGKKVSAEDRNQMWDELKGALDKQGGKGVAFLVDKVMSPTRDRLRDQLLQLYPQLTWTEYDPLLGRDEEKAKSLAFGENIEILPHYDKADLVYSLDCDFLGTDEGGVSAVKAFSKKRKVRKPTDKMSRLYVAENRFTMTGGVADHRLCLQRSHIPGLVVEIAKVCVKEGKTSPALESAIASSKAKLPDHIDKKWVEESAKDLVAHAGKSIVNIGSTHAAPVQLLVYSLNEALGNLGKTMTVRFAPEKQEHTQFASIAEMAKQVDSGAVETVVILGGNPVYDLPKVGAYKELWKKVKKIVRWGLFDDETSAIAHWQIPAAHYLESWGDTLSLDGTYLSIQPLILPLYGGISQIEFLSKLMGVVELPMELVKETFRNRLSSEPADEYDFKALWERFVHGGFLEEQTPKKVIPSLRMGRVAKYLSRNGIQPGVDKDELELVFVPSYSMDDGRYIDNAWMQEAADPITKLTWDNAILINPKTADELGLESKMVRGIQTSDIVRVKVGDKVVEGPILKNPGHARNSITVSFGYGRTSTGFVGEDCGYDAYKLLDYDFHGFASEGVSIEKVDKKEQKLAVTQEHHSMEGRAIVREAPLDYYKKYPDFTSYLGVEGHSPVPIESFYEPPPLTDEHQWAMVIDLTSCTGCNACIVACQSENNIPVVGRDQVMKGREMHWVRVDRYFSGSDEDAHAMLNQPVSCMHCENAPCETVCPVNATVHSEDGLNVMVYNRCIGTRYCANNCPYKVRRFNYFDYNQRELDKIYNPPFSEVWGAPSPKGSPETVKMSKNPNVTVRMRGVMEKCTYCVQRLQEAKINAKVKARDSKNTRIKRDSVLVACQQACPADCIVFGDKSDPGSAVSQHIKLDHNYSVLGYLNVKPRTTYLARLRNPNPRMPDAHLVADEFQYELEKHEKHKKAKKKKYGKSHDKGHGSDDEHAYGNSHKKDEKHSIKAGEYH